MISTILLTLLNLVLLSPFLLLMVDGFSSVNPPPDTSTTTCHRDLSLLLSNDPEDEHDSSSSSSSSSFTRRNFLASLAVAPVMTEVLSPLKSFADGVDVSSAIEMEEFKDPYGMFAINVPKGFFKLRRTAKGDLPDAKTGKGRRGSSIFTAGNLAKAEVIAVERFPTRLLLEENGIEATGKLSSFPDIGEPQAIAHLLNIRREKESTSKTDIVPNSVKVSKDGRELEFKLRAEIQVQRPELLFEQYGVSELFRVTTAKASLTSSDGNILAVFASALETDFNGPDGTALQNAVDSFQVIDREWGF